jgi:hypothetical protein
LNRHAGRSTPNRNNFSLQRPAAFIFNDALGDPIADTILTALRGAPEGLSCTEISGLFGRSKPASIVSRAIGELEKKRLIRRAEQPTQKAAGR